MISRTFLLLVEDVGKNDIATNNENITEHEENILMTSRESEELVLILIINNI